MESVWVQGALTALQVISFTFDVITFPIYLLLQRPWKRQNLSRRVKAEIVSKDETQITYRKIGTPRRTHIALLQNNIDTLEKVFKYVAKLHTTKRCLGTREILGEADEVQANGKVFKKLKLGEYKWKNFLQVELLTKYFGKGMREIGVQPRDKVVIFADTRAEWMIAAQGLFRQSCTIVTIYATLGEDGLAHGFNDTEVSVVVTSHELLPKIRNILKAIPKVNKIVFFEDQLHKTNTNGFGDVEVIPFSKILTKGEQSEVDEVPPSKDDIAIIMYTSGSTGVPKGVLLTHGNCVATMTNVCDLADIYADDVYIAYLPLAHVLELTAENFALLNGVPIGYSTPNTLIDTSSMIMKGCKGDATVLQPTCMSMVPLILDRVAKGIDDKVNKGSTMQKILFKFAYDYKRNWHRRGYETPILNKLIFSKISSLLGGRVRLVVCGGAPLSADTHQKINLCLNVNVLQGYGLTETTAAATIMDIHDLSYGRTGAPLAMLSLVNWEEGNYRVTNEPYPQGEILLGGDNISIGYYNLPDKTKEEFFEDNGVRWFRSGDIGEIHPDGVLVVIDRKKDLVKLQAGEYVSLGKVESELKTSPFVDNICVYADSMKNFCVALIVPNEKALKELAKSLEVDGDLKKLCTDQGIVKNILKQLSDHANNRGLLRYETPVKITLCKESWTPDSGLVTAAFKIKRREIQEYYKSAINEMYA